MQDGCSRVRLSGTARGLAIALASLASLSVFQSVSACAGSAAPSSGCTSNSQCPHGDTCTAFKCVSNPSMVACMADSDCAAGDTCLGGLCVSPQQAAEEEDGGGDGGSSASTTCMQDSDCSGSTPVCNTTTAVCVACNTTSDCVNAELICNTQNQCVYMLGDCGSDSDCSDPALATTPVCDTTHNICVGCTGSDQANCTTAGLVCNTITETCATMAPLACTSNAGCSGGTPVCNTTTGGCVECMASTDCPSGDVCTNTQCVTGSTGGTDAGMMGGTDAGMMGPMDSGMQTGNSCTTSTQCSGNSVGTHCLTTGVCGCKTNAECVTGDTCDTTTDTCTSGSGGIDAGTGLGCIALNNCLANCTSQNCANRCDAEASSAGQTALTNVLNCLDGNRVCPLNNCGPCDNSLLCFNGANTCYDCQQSAIGNGGPCAAVYQTCEATN